MSSEIRHFYEFGDFRFDDGKRILWRDGDVVSLTPKAADLLFALIERRGDVLERSELLDKVWKDTFVEEGNLSYTVSNLRKILGKNGSNGFIQTVPRRGYRFTAELRDSWDEGDSDIVIERSTLSETVIDEFLTTNGPNKRSAPKHAYFTTSPVAVALLAVGIVLIAAVAWQLTRESSANSPSIRSIAVLPFKTIYSANQEPHRGLGMADILITRLSSIRGVTVRPTTAVTAFENIDADALEIGNKLGVDAVVEGTIYDVADGVRVNARMTRVSDGTALWQGVFNKPLRDVLSIENEISMELANALSLNLRADAKKFTDDTDAYQLYVKGRYEWNKRDYQGLAKAQHYFRSAIQKDPDFALAYVGLADSLVFFEETPELNYSLAKAIELDPNLGEAYATLGFVQTVHQWKWAEAEANFARSIELNPGYPTAHHWYAILLGIQGRYKEAKSEMQKALDINPVSYNYLADMGQIYYFERDYASAKQFCNKALELYPDFLFANEHLESISWQLGDHETAIDAHVRAINTIIRTANPTSYAEAVLQKNFELFKSPYRQGGLKGWVEFYLERSNDRRNPNTQYGAARYLLLIGEKEKALDSLEIALERKPFMMAWVKADPAFDSIRTEPRYQEILKKMGLR